MDKDLFPPCRRCKPAPQQDDALLEQMRAMMAAIEDGPDGDARRAVAAIGAGLAFVAFVAVLGALAVVLWRTQA